MAFYLGSVHPQQAPEAPLFEAFASDFRQQPASALRFLAEAADSRSEQDIESMLAICCSYGALSTEAVPLLCRLLTADYHGRHEDVARYLQDLRAPRSVDALYEACFLDLPYFFDDGDALARKCIWALSAVGTPEAVAALRRLTRHPRESVVGYAQKRLHTDSSA